MSTVEYSGRRATQSAVVMQSAMQFPQCQNLARSVGLEVLCLGPNHFRVKSDAWEIKLYPSRRRIVVVSGKPPFVDFRDRQWSLKEVVFAFVQAVKARS